jgi:membrane protein
VFDIGALSRPQLARRTWREAIDDDVLGLAAELSYYFFLALFPGDLVPPRTRELLSALEHHDDVSRSARSYRRRGSN